MSLKYKETGISKRVSSLTLFSLVPIAQLFAFFVSNNRFNQEIHQATQFLKLSQTQLIVFEVLLILIYSTISFLIAYLISRFFMEVFSEKVERVQLFVSFVISTAFTAIANSIAISLTGIRFTFLFSIFQIILLLAWYIGETKARDKKGAIALFIVNVIFNIVPAILL